MVSRLSKSSLLSSVNGIPELFASILSITQYHICVFIEQNWILHTSVSRVSDRSLEHKNLVALPDSENRHAINTTIRIVLCSTAYGIRRSDYQCDIGFYIPRLVTKLLGIG